MKRISLLLKYLFLFVCSFLSLFPFYWMIVGATNTSNEIAQGKLLPGTHFIQNLNDLFAQYSIGLVMWNSIKVATVTMLLSLLITSLAAFGFEKFGSRSTDRLYSLLLLFMMIPLASLVIPLFRMLASAHLVNTHTAVILPTVTNIFLIFFFRQSFRSFPDELIDSARMEGAGNFQIFFRIVFPVMRSTYAAAAIYSFMNAWNSFLLPLIVLQTEDKFTMPLLISGMSTASYVANYGIQLLAIIIATLPTLVLFLLMQRSFVEGMTGSLKG